MFATAAFFGGDTPGVGVMRRWTTISGSVLYSPSTDYVPPTISSTDAVANGSDVIFTVHAKDADAEMQFVLRPLPRRERNLAADDADAGGGRHMDGHRACERHAGRVLRPGRRRQRQRRRRLEQDALLARRGRRSNSTGRRTPPATTRARFRSPPRRPRARRDGIRSTAPRRSRTPARSPSRSTASTPST